MWKAPIWKFLEYKVLRDKLLSPVPAPSVSFSDSGCVTVDVLNKDVVGKSPSSSQKGRCDASFLVGFENLKKNYVNECTLFRMHIAVRGISLPIDLQSIKYSIAFIEICEGMLNVHAIVAKIYFESEKIIKK